MATYKITYLPDNNSSRNEIYVNNVYDEYDAVEVGMYTHKLSDSCKILNVEFICE